MTEQELKESSGEKSGTQVAAVILWWLLLMILSSLTGAWIKIFWVGWVFS